MFIGDGGSSHMPDTTGRICYSLKYQLVRYSSSCRLPRLLSRNCRCRCVWFVLNVVKPKFIVLSFVTHDNAVVNRGTAETELHGDTTRTAHQTNLNIDQSGCTW
jgi:hypothetical protein